jgi:hypothetical protein
MTEHIESSGMLSLLRATGGVAVLDAMVTTTTYTNMIFDFVAEKVRRKRKIEGRASERA